MFSVGQGMITKHLAYVRTPLAWLTFQMQEKPITVSIGGTASPCMHALAMFGSTTAQ